MINGAYLNHANAVTTATSASTGTMNYAYDASGNMVSRNGDVLRYDSFGKLIEITPNGGTASINYNYDYSGNRIKAVSDAALTTTYSFGDSYEIVRASGLPEKHTVYVKGIEGEIVAQWTREDATLQLSDSVTEDGSQVATSIVGTLTKPFCKDVSIDCGDYWKNRVGKEIYSFIGYSSYFQEGVPTKLYNALYFLILLGVLYLAYPYFLRGNTLLHELSWKGTATPALLLAMFVITSLPGCGILPGGSGQGDPPWVLAMGANVNPSVPSIQNGNSGASGGGINGGTPVNGMFFYHPDHLGSVTMITDGYGNPASGPEPGVSYVSYEPYGSINRNDSYGPDIFRYKYTGQVEDKESGLYFYKARYYEPTLGRFLQADSQVMPDSPNGMNRYMYVDGNPVNFRDPSGHVGLKGLIHMFNRIVGHAMGKDFDSKGNDKKLSTNGISTGGNRFLQNATFAGKGRYYFNAKSINGNKLLGIKKMNRWMLQGQGEYLETSRGMAWEYVRIYANTTCNKNNSKEFCDTLALASALVYNREADKHDRSPINTFATGWWDWKIRPTPEDDEKRKLALICVYYNITEGHLCGFEGDSK
ncbi:RHS repeat-associated core domain-containing protein [Leptospira sp. 201903071]|nr:RHS repeat-associated core domain-containing protein [Leptospira ainazelensis]